MKIKITAKAQKSLLKLPSVIQKQIIKAIDRLAVNYCPAGAKRLTNQPGFRLRIGDYRVLYLIDYKTNVLTIVRIVHRSRVYRRMEF